MIQEEIIEGNKLIAEFDGWEFVCIDGSDYLDYIKDGNSRFKERESSLPDYLESLGYHESWDSIMPVVRKICIINSNDISEELHLHQLRLIDTPIFSEIEIVWQAVVEFITWYNNSQ